MTDRKDDQVARSILYMPYWQVKYILDAVTECERQLSRPPNCMHVYAMI